MGMEINKAAHDLVAKLNNRQLLSLITDHEMGGHVIDHANNCDVCSRRVEEANKVAYDDLSAEERRANARAVRRALRKIGL